jgi:hypothetical protein
MTLDQALLLSAGYMAVTAALWGAGAWAVIRWGAPKVHDRR